MQVKSPFLLHSIYGPGGQPAEPLLGIRSQIQLLSTCLDRHCRPFCLLQRTLPSGSCRAMICKVRVECLRGREEDGQR